MDINDKLIEIFIDIFDLTPNQVTSSLKKDDVVKWDSLAQMELVIALERKFDINLNIEEVVKLDSMKEIIKLLDKKGVKM